MDKTQEALKQALEALEYISSHYMSLPKIGCMALAAVEEALADQPAQQQEPVAWIVEDQSGERLEWAGDAHSCHGVPTFPLYTSPPAQRTWVGLTDEEMDDCWNKLFGTGNYNRRNVYRDIEAKLKEKNT